MARHIYGLALGGGSQGPPWSCAVSPPLPLARTYHLPAQAAWRPESSLAAVTTLALPTLSLTRCLSLLFSQLEWGRHDVSSLTLSLGTEASILAGRRLASWCLLFGSTSELRKVTDDGLNLFGMQIVEWYKWLSIGVSSEFLNYCFCLPVQYVEL